MKRKFDDLKENEDSIVVGKVDSAVEIAQRKLATNKF